MFNDFNPANLLITKYGQDLKNEQWALEPLADMVISLCIMDSGFKRYNQLGNSQHKDEVREVLLLSIAEQFEKIRSNGIDLVKYLDTLDGISDRYSHLSDKLLKIDYSPDRIHFRHAIAATMLKHGKYYLD